MARIHLITGGSRSGKSDYALKTAEAKSGRHIFVATCPVTDDEMARRIQRHKEQRSSSRWETVEEPSRIAEVLQKSLQCDVILVDCLTLWVNNLMYEASQKGIDFGEEEIALECKRLLKVCEGLNGTVIFVTNEVGSAIVPENPLARRYRDLVGRCNQIVAHRADAVTMVVSGLPLSLK
jgi:adenosylcobinamide kinase / adenosylcobinamide-phosphate guanylyltransferase